jgi:SAM-dependent methyltransferase
MSLTLKVRNRIRAVVQRYGPNFAKRYLWNHEFASGRWDCLDRTPDERIQAKLKKFARCGAILDLGCGSGTASVDLAPAAYSSYTGIDISDVAVRKAEERARAAGRANRNEYYQSDIVTYVPARKYQVIIFGDSIYYIPHDQIADVLKRYSKYLENDGVFVVRVHDESGKHKPILETINFHFHMVETDVRVVDGAEVSIVVFQPISTEQGVDSNAVLQRSDVS